MIGTLYHYVRKYAAPQGRRIFFNTQVLLIVLFGIFLFFNPDVARKFLAYELVYQYVSYNFMAFGFTIAALTIVFVAPTGKFTDYMFEMSEKHPKLGQGPWEDALFVMSWNGFCHFAALICSVAAMALTFNLQADHAPFVYEFNHPTTRGVYAAFLSLQAYAFSQFLLTMLSVYFFCSAYVRHLRAQWQKARSRD